MSFERVDTLDGEGTLVMEGGGIYGVWDSVEVYEDVLGLDIDIDSGRRESPGERRSRGILRFQGAFLPSIGSDAKARLQLEDGLEGSILLESPKKPQRAVEFFVSGDFE